MTLLDAHLEQIEVCSTTLADLPFAQPKIFTNAMLHSPDITALIRDTEAHELALFSLVPKNDKSSGRNALDNPARRGTAFSVQEERPVHDQTFRAPRRGTAVAAMLGGDLQQQIRWEYNRSNKDSKRERRDYKNDIDVEVLLRGAEKLCEVYSMAGAAEKIASLRNRNARALASMEEYEDLVAEQTAQLGKMNRPSGLTFDDDEGGDETTARDIDLSEGYPTHSLNTEEALRRDEQTCAELEQKKRMLEERVSGMEKDLGGLMR